MRQVEHTFSNSPHSQRERIFHPVGFVETRGDGGRSMGYAGASKMLRMRGEHLWHSWELRCARSELKALQVEWLAKRPEDGSERFPSVRAVPEGLPPDPVEQHSAERPEIPAQASSSSGDPLAALAAVWSGTQEDVSQAPAPEAREAQATCHPSALPEDSVPESRREATGPSVPEADAVDGPEAQREDSVDSPVGVLPADVLSGSPVSEVDHRPEENAFDGSGPDVPGVQSASVMSEVQAQVGDAADAPAESDVGHLEAAAPAAEPLGPAELDPSEAGSNSAWVSTAAPNPLASSEGDPEEDGDPGPGGVSLDLVGDHPP
ncbi:unnamed protein product [Cladocopium goreaui]|uniref:Uncharacterized protein n=1 Tax=Cladocopium goreaui TaxID=2562237 RepID=A0A9P1DHP7_9DINO|nr:unnamed protein product [Cladocopium goreaui]